MLLSHLHRLQPVCPACRAAGREGAPLGLGTVARAERGESDDDIREGVLLCPEPRCQREHPIIDGIPVVVADIASWAAHQLAGVLRRDDLSPFTESLLGDAAGPGSDFDRARSNLSIYGWAHWGDLVPDVSTDVAPGAAPNAARGHGGAYVALLDAALAGLQPAGLWLDLGCSVGRGTLELARRGAELAVGVDLNFAMLRVAEHARHAGRARFALRRGGVVFDRFDAAVPGLSKDRVSYWCCDVSALPFDSARFDGALLLNLLDCVPAPLELLVEAARVLVPGAAAAFSSPYDWSPSATPLGQWLGGHSQRSAHRGDSAAELRRILSPECLAGIDTGFVIEAERERVPWHVQTGERSTMAYAVHLARLRRKG
jgi:SAM-dependent methyltransferase